MAVAAVGAVATDVAFVTERNGLLARDLGLGDPGRPVHLCEQDEERRGKEDGAEEADARDGVGTAVKDLGQSRGCARMGTEPVAAPGANPVSFRA